MYSLALIIFVVSEKKAFEHFPIGETHHEDKNKNNTTQRMNNLDTGNIRHTRHMTKTKINKTQKNQKNQQHNPHEIPGVNLGARER